MNDKLHLFKELSKFVKENKNEHPELKKQFELYINEKKKYDATKNAIDKNQKTKTYGVKYK